MARLLPPLPMNTCLRSASFAPKKSRYSNHLSHTGPRATVEAGYYYEVVLPNGLRQRIPQSISFSKMDEDTFQSLYKDVFNVLWNFILFRKFNSQREAENVAMQLLEFA